MKRLLLINALLILGLGLNSLMAQSTWDGGASTTNWEDGDNWDPNGVPAAGAVVTFSTSVTVTGTAANVPAQIKASNGADVVLDLSMSVGDGVYTEHALQINANSSISIASGRTISVNMPSNKNGVSIFGGANNASFVVNGTGELVVTNGQHGVSIANGTSSITNNGTITITNSGGIGIRVANGTFTNNSTITIAGSSSDGIENTGTFTNSSGMISIEDAGTNGIENVAGGSFTNDATIEITNPGTVTVDGISSNSTFLNDTNGTISITGPSDDGIEVMNSSSFTNDGAIDIASSSSGGSENHAVLLDEGTFDNNGELTAMATDSGSRTFRVVASSTFTNTGVASLSGGNAGQMLRVEGSAVNETAALLNLNEGRVILQVNAAFTNNGLITSTRSSTPVFRNATGTQATNNGFYDGNNGSSIAFSSGDLGTETDNGIDLNNTNDTEIDAGMSCDIDLAEQPYTWTDGASYTAAAAANGNLTLPDNTFPSDPISLTTTIQGTDITLEISNFCVAALPIELLNFNGTPMAKSVMLKWQTATEINNDYMAVERSTDARTFAEIGRLAGAGNSNALLNYGLEDEQPANGVNYYRLRQVDTDGAVAYSEVIAVRFAGNENNEEPLLYPTLVPKGGNVYLDLRKETPTENQTWSLHNTDGQQIALFQVEGGNLQSLRLPALSAGMYVLTNTGAPGKTILKFIIAD